MPKHIDSNGRLYFFPNTVSEGINVDANGRVFNIKDTGAGVYDIINGIKFIDISLASYLLDSYSAAIAYSTRQLSSTATNCLRVREDSGNTETDIGFVDGWLDEAAIASHCGANNGYVVTWYDQSGSGYDATQATTTKQPQIYNGSAVIK